MKNPLFQVISPTTALVTNSSHIICYVLEHIRGNNEDPRCPHKRAPGILFIVAALRCLLVHAVLTDLHSYKISISHLNAEFWAVINGNFFVFSIVQLFYIVCTRPLFYVI